MVFVLLSVVCSVLVSALLKLAPQRRIDLAQAVTWNYLAALLLCAALLHPPLAALKDAHTPWAALLALGVLLPSIFLVLGRAVASAGIVRTDAAQRLSLLLSLAAAFLWFGERANGVKLAGLALGLLAIAGIVQRPDTTPRSAARTAPWLLLVWVGFAAIDVLLKRIAQAGTPFAASLLVAFALAFVLLLGVQLWRHLRGSAALAWRNLGAGLLVGTLNFGNILFYVRAHQALPDSPASVFAAMNLGVIGLGTVLGIAVFGEQTNRWNRLGLLLAVPAIVLIALGARG
ncbi:drug/metabolite transporter (DMT)-like permease [Xanthomonas sacchari]|uniref:EamA family transporter n=1 Tax=Xanthomonas sacchari TaxID=56458 RepID=UPI002783CFAD|nr:EamA/RhaT family transporter [Xanthomonas sacchari]MDQ1090969.1 drug/metabolite transporter (DMT)-like permease [Xanthomonas sacchari]